MKADWRVLSTYLIGVFVGALDAKILGPALPLIAHSFHTTLGWTAWTVTAYTAAYVASTVLAGAIGDRYGRRRLFSAGVMLFGAASLLASLSPTFGVFIVARIIQGLGAGAVYPNAQAEGIRQFPLEKRGTALGIFGAVFGLAALIGPNVGGALAQGFGWPAIFVVNVPIALIVVGLSLRLPASETHAGPIPDVAGGLAFSGALAAALLALSISSPIRFVLLAVAVAMAFLFRWRQRGAAEPFLDSAPLRRPSGALLMVGAALIGLDISAAVFVPTLAQTKLHMSVLMSGVALMPAAIPGAALAGVGGVLVDRIGPKRVLQVGLLGAAIGGLLLADPSINLPVFILAMVGLGIGTAFTLGAPVNRMALALYRDEQAGQALSLVAVFRAVGLAAGPILLTAAYAWQGFTAMFGAVAVASLLAVVVFSGVADVPSAAADSA